MTDTNGGRDAGRLSRPNPARPSAARRTSTSAPATIPPLGAQDRRGDEAIAQVKLFVPGSRWTLFICEHDPAEALVFGFVVSPLGPDCDEWGYASLHEIARLRVPFGLPPERDLDFAPRPVREAREQHRLTGEGR